MLGKRRRLFLAEGLDVFTTPVPRALVGHTLANSHIRQDTGCNVLAGDRDAEERFLQRYPE